MESKPKSYGVYYGYPKCCIRSFHKMLNNKLLASDLSEVRRKAAKNGFIPCLSHAKEIEAGKIKIEELILPTRQCERPFIRTVSCYK